MPENPPPHSPTRESSQIPKILALFTVFGFISALFAGPLPAQPMVVIPFGDSITFGLGDDITNCEVSPRGYPARLRGRLNARGLSTVMRIRAVCGEETGPGVTRLRTVLRNNPDARLVLIMEGTNDFSTTVSPETARDNIGFMIDSTLEAGMRPVVASVIPRAPEGGNNIDTARFNDLLRELTAERDIDFVDQYRLVNIDNLYDRFYWDPLHPNAQGYDLVADNWIDATLAAAQRPIEVEPCEPDGQTLCLNEERFQIDIEWEDFEGNTGVGQAVPLTSDTGYFWFFEESNIELVVKALDGRAFNDFYWIFYGALSTVEYTMTVVDTETGRRKTYFNPANNLASVGDTAAFPGEMDDESGVSTSMPILRSASKDLQSQNVDRSILEALQAPPVLEKRVIQPPDPDRAAKMSCTASAEVLCLLEERFAIRIRWRDFEQRAGNGKGVKLTSDSGYFWFFADTNVEVMIKVLDGRGFNDKYWVFYGALSNVEYEIEVTDTETGETVIYFNPSRNFGSRADIEAFDGS